MNRMFCGTIVAALLFSQPLLASHQAGPDINCVAVVYDDLTFDIVPWADVEDLDPGIVIEVRIIQDFGASGGPGALVFTGSAAYAIFKQGPNLLVRAFNPGVVGTGVSKERLFRASGSQSATVTRATGLANTASSGATREFTSISVIAPTNGRSFEDWQADAVAVDVGFCSPDP